MRQSPLASLASSSLMVVALVAGCGSPASSTTSYVCQPACPTGTTCTADGCVATGVLADFAVAVIPGSDGGGCSPACSGATPHCNLATLQCAPCLEDSHCPSGQVCKQVGASTACVTGCSDDARCAGGPGSPKCCGGGCVDVSADPSNCGVCGTTCMATHGTAACAEGACAAGACEAPWADCNGDPTDGCETNLHADPANCGACKAACKIKNAVAACSGTCYVAACAFGYDDCNGDPTDGCEIPVTSDNKNCGACGNACNPPPNGKSSCVNASCALASCNLGYADCNNNPKDGCEVFINSDKNNCGACGNACGQGLVCTFAACTCPQCNIPNAKSSCVNNICTLTSCLPGWDDCDKNVGNGCEISLTDDPKNCGACGNVCPNNLPSCLDGVCGIIQCLRQGWKFGKDNWDCPQNYRMPTVNEWDDAVKCAQPGDLAKFEQMHDIAVSVGGCNCKWNNNWCGQPSIETIHGGRMCGDFDQLHICLSG